MLHDAKTPQVDKEVTEWSGSFASVKRKRLKITRHDPPLSRDQVYSVMWEDCAIKTPHLNSPMSVWMFVKECQLHATLHHAHIAAFLGTKKGSLITKFSPGQDLFFHVEQHGRMPVSEVRSIARQLMSAVWYLHCHKKVLHRDIKPGNLVYDYEQTKTIKLHDFGLSVQWSDQYARAKAHFKAGSPKYLAPELLDAKTPHMGYENDMFSCGATLFTLLVGGCIPYYKDTQLLNLTHVQLYLKRHVSDSLALDFVFRLLHADYQQRMTVEQACDHAWIKTV